MLPTCVGMNRNIPVLRGEVDSVPHVRGDEPDSSMHIEPSYNMWAIDNNYTNLYLWGQAVEVAKSKTANKSLLL